MRTRHVIATPRLRLEPTVQAHAGVVFAALDDDEMWKFFPALRPKTLEELRERYRRFELGYPHPDGKQVWENWIAFLHDNDEPVGGMQATIVSKDQAYIAYAIHRVYWRNGYGGEAARAVINHLQREHGVRTVFAEMNTGNFASITLAESLGFKRLQTRRNVDSGNGLRGDEYLYELTLALPSEIQGPPSTFPRP